MSANVITASGGKDSTAMWLLSLECEIEPIIVFCDTGHEHPLTYEYLDYLEGKLGPIKRILANFTERIERKRITVQTKWRDEGISEEIIQRALMGQGQYAWEPPRVAEGVKDRTGRLKALGNAVNPLQIYPIMYAIKYINDRMTLF